MPVLVTDQGTVVFDSCVICAYLDRQHSSTKLIPDDEHRQTSALCLQALADGITEAGILARWEAVRRPENLRYEPLLEGQLAKLSATYDYIEQHVPLDGALTIGEIALATSLSWLEFRELPAFKERRPKLSTWYEEFSSRPSMMATEFSGETHD